MRTPKHPISALRAAWRAASDDVVSRETPCFRVVNADSDRPKLYVYDMIGGWDNDAGEFVQAVHAIDAPAIDLHINSPGGFVYDAVAMYEALAGHDADVHVKIDGLAASAASFLAMSGTTVDIAKGGRMMIHDAQGIAIGGPAELREYADLFDAVSDDIAQYYADRAGGSAASWRQAMTATTWYSSSEAVDAKLADRVTGGSKAESAENRASQLVRARARVALGGVK
jgi:ATP-dependent protease ClpP protease subunit